MKKVRLFNFLMIVGLACLLTGCVQGTDLSDTSPEVISAVEMLIKFGYIFLFFSVTGICLLTISEVTKRQLTKVTALGTVVLGFVFGNILFAAIMYAMFNGSLSLMALKLMLTSIPILGIVFVISAIVVWAPNNIVKIMKNIH